MKEGQLKKVMTKYFEIKREAFKVQKGPGPDILKEGTALEIKGSIFKVPQALGQLTRYALNYGGLEVAFPLHTLDLPQAFSFLCGLWLLEKAIQYKNIMGQKNIVIYMADKIEQGKYSVLKYNSVEDLLKKIKDKLEQEIYTIPRGEDIEKIEGIISSMITKINLKEKFEKDIRSSLACEILLE